MMRKVKRAMVTAVDIHSLGGKSAKYAASTTSARHTPRQNSVTEPSVAPRVGWQQVVCKHKHVQLYVVKQHPTEGAVPQSVH